MNAAAPIAAVYGRTADDYLAALVGDLAHLAVPVADGLRIQYGWRPNRPIAKWTRADFHGGIGTVQNEAGFRAYVEDYVQHCREKQALGRTREPGNGVWTPWGMSQGSEVYADGVAFHSTASHGGFRLDEARRAAMLPALRVEGGWYEEDCEWAKVALAFPELFTTRERRMAEKTLRHDFPDCWEAVHGRLLAPGESFDKDRRLFEEAHAQDWIVISASQSQGSPGVVECVAALGGKRDRRPYRGFLVPNDEYRSGPHGFVIDEARHKSWELPTRLNA